MGSEDKYRSFIYGDGEKNTQWRFGSPPNYDVVNKLFEEGRTHEWEKGSLEEKVQRLVKTFEMEIFHKSNPEDFKIINSTKFRFSLNGGKELTIQEIGKMGGGYNAFLQTKLPKQLRIYDPQQETFSTSHELFTTVFPRGFALEILEVLSGPPRIVYKFRHWGFMEGPFKGHAPTGEKVEVYGMSIFHRAKQTKEMATAISAIVGRSTSLCCALSPPPRKGKEGPLSMITRRSCTAAAGRLSWGGAGKRMPNFTLFSSNSDQQPEEAEG